MSYLYLVVQNTDPGSESNQYSIGHGASSITYDWKVDSSHIKKAPYLIAFYELAVQSFPCIVSHCATIFSEYNEFFSWISLIKMLLLPKYLIVQFAPDNPGQLKCLV